MGRELAKLNPRLTADGDGYGGDGRKLSPFDNGGPRIIDSPPRSSTKKNLVLLSVILGGVGTVAFLLNKEVLLDHISKDGRDLSDSVDDFLDALAKMLHDALS